MCLVQRITKHKRSDLLNGLHIAIYGQTVDFTPAEIQMKTQELSDLWLHGANELHCNTDVASISVREKS